VNVLNGGDGNDTLIGGRGRDRMIGGRGADRFVFTAPGDGVKRIMDFNRREGDKLVILNQAFEGYEGFEGLRSGRLRRNQFHVGNRAQNRRHRFIYNENRGILFYDADGVGGQRQVRIATFADKPSLRASDIIVAASPL
jgi:Ca2+-binding RTX toxin-like protein